MATTPKFSPTLETGKATPESLYEILKGRTCTVTDKGQWFDTSIPSWFPPSTAFDNNVAAEKALAELCTKFGFSEILGKVMSQFLIDFRAAARAKYGKEFDPTTWTPNLAPVKKLDDLEKLGKQLDAMARKMGISVEELKKILAK